MADVTTKRSLAQAASQVIALVRECVIEPGQSITASLEHIAELRLDTSAEYELIGELDNLRKSLNYRLRDDTAAIARLKKSITQFDLRLRRGE